MRNMPELCLQQEAGSCLGCNILEIVRNQVIKGVVIITATKQTQAEYCPPGFSMQTDLLKSPREVNWGAVKLRSNG